MIVEELAARLGLDVDQAAFAKGFLAIEGLRIGFEALIEIGKAVAHQIREATIGVAENAIEVSKAAQRTGVTVEAYQEMAFAAEQSGLSQEGLEHGLRHLSHTLMEAATGSGDAAYTVKQLGISMYDANGKAKTTDKVMEDVARRISSMPDGWKKTALAQQAFGRAGSELIPLLNKGKEGIEKLRQAAHDYGNVLDADTIAAAKRWNEQNKALKASVQGLRNAIGSGLLKQMGDLTGRIAEWIRVNRDLIASNVLGFIDHFRGIVEHLIQIVDAVFIKTDAWKYALLALVGVMVLLNAPLLALIGAILVLDDVMGFMEGKHSFIETLFPADKLESVRKFINEVKDFWKWITSGGIGDALADLAGKGQASDNGLARVAEFFGFKKGGAFLPGGFAQDAAAGQSFNPDIPTQAIPLLGPNQGAAPGYNNLSVHQTINATPGMNAQDVANASRDAFRDEHQRMMRETQSAVNQ